MARPAVVFLGPSLDHDAASRILPNAEFRRPIKRGDLTPLLDAPPAAIGIVDGEFYQSLSISTKEILPFLKLGVPVFGSSSMGALRAVELERHGMRGVGTVFDWFRRGRLDADDEVAMTFCPETLRPSSEPMVNFRVALREAQRAGVLTPAERTLLSRAMKRRYFPDRTTAAFFFEAARTLGDDQARELRGWWTASAPNAKAEDAAELLRELRALTA